SLQLFRDKKPTDVVFEPRAGWLVYETVSFVGPDRIVFGTSEGHLDLHDVSEKGKGKRLAFLAGFNGQLKSGAPYPGDNGRYLPRRAEDQCLHVWDTHRLAKDDPTRIHPGRLLSLFVAPAPEGDGGKKRKAAPEWIAWTPEGYYAASVGGERLMGWHVNNGTDKLG